MKNRIGASAIGVCLMSASLLAFSGPAVAAPTVDATLRVVTYKGKILADRELSTSSTVVRSSKKADCFGPGSSNASTSLTGPTALGLLSDGAKKIPALSPLTITNSSSFGLGLCGIGNSITRNKEWWVLKVNHKDSSVGGQAQVVKNGDSVLWFMARSYSETTPSELVLKVPASAKKNKPVRARVLAYDSKGKSKPVEGAKLANTNAPLTNARGYTTVKFRKTVTTLARFAGTIPSNRVKVAVKG